MDAEERKQKTFIQIAIEAYIEHEEREPDLEDPIACIIIDAMAAEAGYAKALERLNN